MAKQVSGQAKFQVPGGQATPAPPVGTSLGKFGINLGQFVQQFNDRTKEYNGTPIPVIVTVYGDRTFDFVTKSPPAAALLKEAAGIVKGSGVPNKEKVGTVTRAQISDIVQKKLADLNATDPENKLLWRFNRRRLTGEEVRDSVLALGPGLDNSMGGTLLKVKNRAYVTGSNTNITDEFDNYRRSVYLPVVRSSVYEVLQALDFPDPAVSNGDRNTTTVAPQALFMMNSSLVDEATSELATRLTALNGSERINRAYSIIMGRQPNEHEIANAQEYTQQVTVTATAAGMATEDAELAAWQSLCRVLLSTNEFFYVE